MVGLDDGDVDLLPQVVGGPAEAGQLLVGVHGVVDEDLGAGLAQGLHGGEDPGEGGLLDLAAVGGPQHDDAQALERAEHLGGPTHHVGGHRGVEGAGGAHHGGVGVGGQVQARVDRDAVPAHRDAGAVDVGVGLGVAGLDDALDVEAGLVGVDGELVGQADVDVAVGGLGELGHLGGLGGAHVPHAVGAGQVVALVEVEDGLVEGDAGLGAGLVQTTHELGVAAQVGEDAAGEDPLGAEDEVEVGPLLQAADLLDHGLEAAPQRAHGQGGLVGDEGVGGQVGGQGAGGVVHPGEVRLPGGVVDEERHDQDDGVGLGDGLGVVGGGAQGAVAGGGAQGGELLGQVGLAGEGLGSGVDGLDDGGVDVDSDDLVTLVCVLDGQRQSDLAQGDDGDAHTGWSFRRIRLRLRLMLRWRLG